MQYRVTRKPISGLMKVMKNEPFWHCKKYEGKWQTFLGQPYEKGAMIPFEPSLHVSSSRNEHLPSYLVSISKSYAYYLSFSRSRIKSCPFYLFMYLFVCLFNHLFISVKIHGHLFYIFGYKSVILYFLVKSFQFCPLGAL